MPRLSIIVPHRQDDLRLEATLISILENRPSDCEVIVVHDGTYRDPYQLRDEVVFVEEDQGCSPVRLINAGLMAACSPIVNVVLDGARIDKGWSERPMDILDDCGIASVAVSILDRDSRHTGIIPLTRAKTQGLMRGAVDQTRSSTGAAGPALSCGFYRRKIVLALGGWNESLELSTADVEMAWMMQSLGLICEHAGEPGAATRVGLRRIDASMVGQLASLAVACGISVGGIATALSDLAKGLLRGNLQFSAAWAKGLLDRSVANQFLARLEAAREQIAALGRGEPALRIYVDSASQRHARRAA